MPAVAEPVEQDDGFDDYRRVRFHLARHAGLTRLEAARFAHGPTPIRTLLDLQKQGCPAAVLARIVC